MKKGIIIGSAVAVILMICICVSFSNNKTVTKHKLRETIKLKINDEANVEDLNIKLVSIEDNTCPEDSQCIWQGEYNYVLLVNNKKISLSTETTREAVYEKYDIKISQESTAEYIKFRVIKKNENFILLKTVSEKIDIDENYIFRSYDDFKNKFNSDLLTEEDFLKNNFVLIPLQYNYCGKSDVTPVDYSINGENIKVEIEYTAKCGVCSPEYIYYLLRVEKSLTSVKLDLDYQAINKISCNQHVSYKPLIYLYPEEETNVVVKLGYPNLLTTTYPKYNNGWNVTAEPNGELTDKTGRTFYGLYWEGLNNLSNDFKDGFVVKGEDTATFLEEKLSILGLTEREVNEFIIYWLPKLEENKYNLIRFESIEIINEQMPITVSPKPDTLIRVFMEYKPIDHKINIKKQKLETPTRTGFTVVEWGGSLIK